MFLPRESRGRGAWWAAVRSFTQSQTRLKCLSMHACVGEGNVNPLQHSCLGNPRDRGAWRAAIYGVAQSRTWLKRLNSSSSNSSNGKESGCNAGDQGLIPGLGSSSGEGNGSPLQYSCLEKSMDREAWWATVHGVAKSQTRLSNTHTHLIEDEFSCKYIVSIKCHAKELWNSSVRLGTKVDK